MKKVYLELFGAFLELLTKRYILKLNDLGDVNVYKQIANHLKSLLDYEHALFYCMSSSGLFIF